MHHELTLSQVQEKWHGTLKSYLIGFASSLLLTLTSFFLVVTKLLSDPVTIITIVCLALFQATLQLIFFFHFGREAKPRWETIVFFFMVMVLLIIALGSVWIIFDLNRRMMSNM